MYVELESDLYGVETFPYNSYAKALAGFKRILTKAREQNKKDMMERTVKLVIRVE